MIGKSTSHYKSSVYIRGVLDLTRFGGYLISWEKGDPLCRQHVHLIHLSSKSKWRCYVRSPPRTTRAHLESLESSHGIRGASGRCNDFLRSSAPDVDFVLGRQDGRDGDPIPSPCSCLWRRIVGVFWSALLMLESRASSGVRRNSLILGRHAVGAGFDSFLVQLHGGIRRLHGNHSLRIGNSMLGTENQWGRSTIFISISMSASGQAAAAPNSSLELTGHSPCFFAISRVRCLRPAAQLGR